MNNPETMATLVTQDTGRRQKKNNKQTNKQKKPKQQQTNKNKTLHGKKNDEQHRPH